MFDLYKQLPDCNLEGIQMGITARQWIKIYYMAVFILDPCGTRCELWQHLLLRMLWHTCRVLGRISFRRAWGRALGGKGQDLGSGLGTHFQVRLTWLCSASSQGVGISSVEENLELVKLHCFGGPKDLSQPQFTKDQWFWLSAAVSEIKTQPCLSLYSQKQPKHPDSSRSSLGSWKATRPGTTGVTSQRAPQCCSLQADQQ